MKTEQEQIEEMAKVLCDDCRDNTVFGKLCKSSKGSYICECEKRKATALVQAGYGDVSEYKTDIERLKTEIIKQDQTIIEQNFELSELEEKNKQAQIDTINTIIKYCENPNHWRELKDCKLWGGKSDDLRDFLNGIFKEVEK